ncbi:restriction endonuclease subunit S [Klebsiella michiganensis]|uniref:restriction endonuclease subunit S n=1 Tax=Klebsiella michiganensis TaxID=1134687 RepID=UPI00164F4F5C|nr:restriction endonuclease subunit S [Klebsiella michiganensis]HBM2944833.1 restriction endonuclease subunit S [Klebsiella michiganensis]
MSEFKEIDVGAHLKLTSGFPFASSQFSNEGFPLIRIRDILTSQTETCFNGAYPPGYLIKKGDILIGMDGDFHVVKWRGDDALLNQRVLKVDIQNESALTLDYLFHWLGPFLQKVNDITAATTVKHLSVKDLTKAKAKFPSVSAQKKIALVLNTIDTTIEKTEALITKYKQIKSGLVHDLFTRGVLPNGQLRPPRNQSPELYKNTEVGWIPKEWEVVCMVTLAEERGNSTTIGPFGSDLVATDYRLEGVPVVFVRDIKESGFQWNSKTYVSNRKAQQLNAHMVRSGEILATKMGLPPCVSCLYPDWMPNGIITADVIRLSPDRRKVDPQWLAIAINQDRVMRQVAAITAGVTRPKVTLADFRSIKLAKPPLNEQQRASIRIKLLQEKLDKEQAYVVKLQNQKNGLMQDLFTGKVPVQVDEPSSEVSA